MFDIDEINNSDLSKYDFEVQNNSSQSIENRLRENSVSVHNTNTNSENTPKENNLIYNKNTITNFQVKSSSSQDALQ